MDIFFSIVGRIFIYALLAGAVIVGIELLWYRLPQKKRTKNINQKRVILITGASSGLGRMYAHIADRKYKDADEIWLVARRKERLMECAEGISTKTRCISCDLTREDDINRLRSMLENENVRVRMLFNCAGFGKIGDISTLDIKTQTEMINLNCNAAVTVADMCIPYMQKGDRIVNVCSTAGFQPFQKLGVYAATKSFLLKYTRALRMELLPKKIMVTAVCPYWIKDTEFIPIAESKDKQIKHFPLSSTVASVANVSYSGAMAGFPVVTPGIMCTVHRFFSKLLSDTALVYIWEGIRKL